MIKSCLNKNNHSIILQHIRSAALAINVHHTDTHTHIIEYDFWTDYNKLCIHCFTLQLYNKHTNHSTNEIIVMTTIIETLQLEYHNTSSVKTSHTEKKQLNSYNAYSNWGRQQWECIYISPPSCCWPARSAALQCFPTSFYFHSFVFTNVFVACFSFWYF